MLRNTKWKVDRPKVKVVFRLQFHATNIPSSGWEKLFVCFIPVESGKIIAKTSKANVRNGTCKWADPIYETTRLFIDSRNKRYDDKLYNLIVGMGTSHASILGETTINLAEYADASEPYVVALPLHGSDNGTILHVTVQLLTAKTGFREFEQQFDRGLQSSSNLNREGEPTIATSSSELQISDDHGDKVNNRIHFGSEAEKLISAVEETGIHQDFSYPALEYSGSCNAAESYYADKHDLSGIHESRDSNGTVHSQKLPAEEAERRDQQRWISDHSVNNDLAIAHEENHKLKGSLEIAEAFISELKQELNVLYSRANEMGMETHRIADHLTNEISSGLKLEREIRMLRSECLKFKDELEQLKEIKVRSQFIDTAHDQRVNGHFLVRDRIKKLQEKCYIGIRESDLGFVHSELEVLLGILQNLEVGTGFTRGYDLGENQSVELLSQLNEARSEKGSLIKKMNEMECYYETLVQELEENRDRILGEFQKLRYEHSSCVYSISTCKAETESIRHCMKDQILKFDKERYDLGSVIEDLNNRVMVAEALVQELDESREQILGEFKSLKQEHSTCAGTISACTSKMEAIHHDMNNQSLKFAKERHDLGQVNEELQKRVTAAESLVQELKENQEKVTGAFQRFKDEHSTCADIISTCQTKTELISRDMSVQSLKFAKEKHDLSCAKEELEKRVSDLEKNRKQILGEFQILKTEHLTCADIVSAYKTEIESIRYEMNNQSLKFATERHDLGCIIEELERNQKQLVEDLQSLKHEHSACVDTISTCETETESLQQDMKDQILKVTAERDDFRCVNEELKKRILELEESREQIVREFQSLKNEHSECVDTILTCKTETESMHHDMKDQIMQIIKERDVLSCQNEELKKRILNLEESREQIVGEFQILRDEHFSCHDKILACKTETELIGHDMKEQIVTFTKENHAISCVNEELEKKVTELKNNSEHILAELESLKCEHATCGDTILICKSETELICQDLNDQMLKLAKERDDLGCVNKELEKKVMTLETALERARLNYSVAVMQLQKNLDMLSSQVSSMFETNQNLIRDTFSESSIPLSQKCLNRTVNCGQKQLFDGDDLSDEDFYIICCANLYLDVYTVTLKEKLFEVSIDVNKMKEQLNNYKKKLELSHDKNETEGRSESLRIAFMKEQCETTVQDLKQQLFVSKRNGDDILIKLQDALDEIDSRKKSEASYLKRIEELSLKIVGLEGELESVHAELDCALLNLECCKEEKEKSVTLLQQCEEEKLKIMFELSLLQEQLAQREDKSLLSIMSSGSCFQDLQRELVQLHKANEELGRIYPDFKNFPGDGNALKRVLALEIELAEALTAKKNSNNQFQSSFLKQHGDEAAVFKSFKDINELIRDTLEIKGSYVNVETQLNEMHERYSELSLKFAEVEGERQKLMMIVKNIRSPRNQHHIKRSSSETLDKNLL
uniref:golgin subfamily B member 1-like n=1 Tax=Erigeron canadensis TaxID=72917 RepID=UPI001CB920CC|nr:golgin subfamily B member 1-like [Erigeron canadensis]